MRLDWLDTPLLDARDLWVIVQQGAPDSAIQRALRGDSWWVTPEVQFLREMEFSLRVLAWQSTKDGEKNRNRPEPHPLPNDPRDPSYEQIGGGEGFDTPEEMAAWFGDHPWLRAA